MGFDSLDSLIMDPIDVTNVTSRNGWEDGQMSVDGAIIQPSLFERNDMDKLEERDIAIQVQEDLVKNMYKQEMELRYGNEIIELKNQLNAAIQNVETYRQGLNSLQSQINRITDCLTEDNWFGDCEKEEVLTELCDIIGHEAKKEVYFEATVTVRGRVDVPLGEDYDLHDALSDISVDINNGDVVIDDYDLENAEEM